MISTLLPQGLSTYCATVPFLSLLIIFFYFKKAKEEYVVEGNEDSYHSRIAVHAGCDNYDW